MKVKKVYYHDDGVFIKGHLIKRIFRKPIFIPSDNKCGFNMQIVYDKKAIFPYTATNDEKEIRGRI